MRKRKNYYMGLGDAVTDQIQANASTYDTQSAFSKFNEKQASILGTAAAVVQVIPGIGQVVGAVLGIVSIASGLVAKIFKTSKAKQYEAERAEYNKVNAQLIEENDKLEDQVIELEKAVGEFKSELRKKMREAGVSVSLDGLGALGALGLCIIGCKKKREKKKLDATKQEYNKLVEEQKENIEELNTLMDAFNILTEKSQLIDQEILKKAQQLAIAKAKYEANAVKRKKLTLAGVGMFSVGGILLAWGLKN